MAAKKISELPAATVLAGSELVPIVQGGVTVGATATQIVAAEAARATAAENLVESGRGSRPFVVGTASPQYTILVAGTSSYRVLVTGYVAGATIAADIAAGKVALLPGGSRPVDAVALVAGDADLQAIAGGGTVLKARGGVSRRRVFLDSSGLLASEIVDPTDIPGCVAWYRPEALSALATGAAIAQWDDSSGNGRHLTNATAGQRPTYQTAVQNGRAVVRFDGTDDALFAASSATVRQVLIVAKASEATFTVYRGLVGGATTPSILTGQQSAATFYNDPGATTTFYKDGVLFAETAMPGPMNTFNVLSASSPQFVDPLVLQLGRDVNLVARAWLGDICEVVAYSRVLADSERLEIEAYLKNGWATP